MFSFDFSSHNLFKCNPNGSEIVLFSNSILKLFIENLTFNVKIETLFLIEKILCRKNKKLLTSYHFSPYDNDSIFPLFVRCTNQRFDPE